MKNLIDEIMSIPYFSHGTVTEDMYMRLTKAREYIETKRVGEITGLWLLGKRTCDNMPQILIRSTAKKGSFERLNLIGRLWDFILFDECYDFDSDIVMPIDEDSELIALLKEKSTVTVYNSDKDYSTDYIIRLDGISCADINTATALARAELMRSGTPCNAPEKVSIIGDNMTIIFVRTDIYGKNLGKGTLTISCGENKIILPTEDFFRLILAPRKKSGQRLTISLTK